MNTTDFPWEIIPKMKNLGIAGIELGEHGGPGFNMIEGGNLVMEMARVDASLATTMCVHSCVGLLLDRLGSEEQKKKWIPHVLNMTKIFCFALTEPHVGSDAASISSSVKKVKGGYILNGAKRWISNGNIADVAFLWAKNEKGVVNAFLVEKGMKGFVQKKIENKYSVRMLQNGEFEFHDVFIPEENRIVDVEGFMSVGDLLLYSRLPVAWMATGTALGAYEAAVKYTINRK